MNKFWILDKHQKRKVEKNKKTKNWFGTVFFYKKMKQSKEIRGLSISSIIIVESTSRIDKTSLTTVSSILEPNPIPHASLCLKFKPEWISRRELLFGLAALTLSFLKEDETEREQWSTLTLELELLTKGLTLNLRLGEGDTDLRLRGCCSFRKLFCLVRLVGEFDRTLFCGMEESEEFMMFLDCGLGLVCMKERVVVDSLRELMRVMCGFSL